MVMVWVVTVDVAVWLTVILVDAVMLVDVCTVVAACETLVVGVCIVAIDMDVCVGNC